MSMNEEICLACERSSDEVPLIAMRYRGENMWICPQHLPVLIHKPEQLTAKLPGAANLSAPEDH